MTYEGRDLIEDHFQPMTDETEFRLAFSENYEDLTRFVLRRSPHSDAQAVVAESFLTAWQKWAKRPKATAEIRPWLFAITRNVMRNAARHEQGRPSVERRFSQDEIAGSNVDADPRINAVRLGLTQLSSTDRELLELSAWEELTVRELSIVFGATETAIKVRLHRARKRLAALVEREQLDDEDAQRPNQYVHTASDLP
jgi:RNA polymerase sigma factor (sigma-70 family)